MTEEVLLENLFQGLKLVVLISLIPLLPALVIGFISSFLQAATQIQEQILSYLPKLLVSVAAIYIFSNFIWENTLDYFNSCFLQ